MEEGKSWSKPQLIVLARGTIEENVLAGCKGDSRSGSSVTIHNRCIRSRCNSKCNTVNAS